MTLLSETTSRDMTRDEAARYISAQYFPTARRTLANLAVSGGGPAFRKVGNRSLYSKADCDSWASSRLGPRVHSTSELQIAPISKTHRRQL
jgi:hypothetical protein